MDKENILCIEGVCKTFPGVKALDDIHLAVACGEVHGIVGENGAGKSTLMKILSGVYKKDAGTICVGGIEADITGPMHSQALGISIIYQEFNLVNTLSAAENIYLGRFGQVKNRREMNHRAAALLDSIGSGIEPNRRVADLSMSQKQMLEIAKALSFEAKLIIMDEPTTSLTAGETKALFAIIQKLKAEGITIIYISHKLDEIAELCDRVTVMRDGKVIGTLTVAQMERKAMIAMMVGREMEMEYPARKRYVGEGLLCVKGLSNNKVHDISFVVRRGEVLGLVGLVGSGRTELVRALFGVDKIAAGSVSINGRPVVVSSPGKAKKAGLALVTEDRKQQGLVMDLSVLQNITMASLKKVSPSGVVRKGLEKGVAERHIDALSIKTPSAQTIVGNLSGGNQQKCIIARWLETDPLLLILDEPTRGIDVGAKYEIYQIINKIAQKGGAIIMISSELSEVLNMSDRVLVMREGRLVGEFVPTGDNTEEIMSCAIG